jgi:hypothetical protein
MATFLRDPGAMRAKTGPWFDGNATGGSAVPVSQACLRQAQGIATVSLQHHGRESKGLTASIAAVIPA